MSSNENKIVSKVFVQKNTNGADGGFKKLINSMQSNGTDFYKRSSDDNGLIGENDTVLIKINGQWDERGGTITDLLKSIIESILEHTGTFTGEIIMAENGQAQFGAKGNGGSLDFENNNAPRSTHDLGDFFFSILQQQYQGIE